MLTKRFVASVVAALAAVTAVPGAAGAAAKAAPRLGLFDVVLPQDFDAKRTWIWTRFVPGSAPPVPVPEGARLTIDLADLAGVATATPRDGGWSCRASGATLTCAWTGYFMQGMNLDLAPAPGASEGDSGQVRVKFDVPGRGSATGSMTVKIATVVDLADASGEVRVTGAPGDDVTSPVRVRNLGPVAADGAVAFLTRPYRVRFTERFSNCDYSPSFYGRAEFAACRFDAVVPPGATYEVSPAPPMRITADASAGEALASILWFTPADWAVARQGYEAGGQVFTPGTGPELRLIEVAGQRAGSQTDVDMTNNWGSVSVEVTGSKTADVAAVPATITGRVGESVTMRLGNHNFGPVSVDHSWPQDEPAVFLQVKVPTGVTVTATRSNCWATKPNPPDAHFVPGAAEYVCGDGSVHPAGETIWFEMTFRIDRKVAGAEGRLAITGFPDAPALPNDPNRSNNTALLKVRVLGDDGGGSAGGLPVTGAGTGAIALAGAALLLAGTLVLLVTRRRGRGAVMGGRA